MIKREASARKPPPAEEQTPRPSTSTQQFKTTPRFNFSSTPRPTPSQNLPSSTPAATRYFTPARPVPEQDEIIDHVSEDLQQSIEADYPRFESTAADLGDDGKLVEHDAKRRRLSSSPMLLDEVLQPMDEDPKQDSFPEPLSSPPPIMSSPVTRRPTATNAPRFLISTPAPQPTPQLTRNTFLKPPRFRPPEHSEPAQSQAEPLPDQFSPHRRGQKYLAGGLAAEVRDWLMSIESLVPPNPTTTTRDEWTVKLLVDEISGGGRAGMTTVRGRQVYSGNIAGMVDTLAVLRVVLAGEGQGTGLQKGSRLEVGMTIGIKAPIWEVFIEEVKMGVGVNWKVLT